MIKAARLERERHTDDLPLAEDERCTDALFLADQQTMPLPTDAVRSAAAFRAVLARYHLVPLHLARLSAVPYITIWSIFHGLSVSAAHAALVRQGLLWSTGRAYDEPIATHPDLSRRGAPMI